LTVAIHRENFFYASCNGILAHCKLADEFVHLSLVVILSAIALLLPRSTTFIIASLAKPVWNDCFHRIIGFKCFKSVKILQYYCFDLPFVYMFDLHKWKFLSPVSIVHNRYVVFLQY